jgi:Domain of unknown function (DUF4267)
MALALGQEESAVGRREIVVALVLSGLLGLFLSVMGAWMLTSPFNAVQLFGIDPSHMADIAIAPTMAIRQLALGLIILALALRRKAGALGTVLLIAAIVPVGDFLVAAKAFGASGAIRQLALLPFFLGLGLILVRK